MTSGPTELLDSLVARLAGEPRDWQLDAYSAVITAYVDTMRRAFPDLTSEDLALNANNFATQLVTRVRAAESVSRDGGRA